MPALPAACISPEEHLAQERLADRKSEYLDGEVFALAGASRAHNLVLVNTTAALHPLARLAPDDVHLTQHRAVFAAMERLSSEGARVDIRSLIEMLSRDDPPALGSWATFLGSLDLDLPDLGRMESSIEIVEQWSRERRRRSRNGTGQG